MRGLWWTSLLHPILGADFLGHFNLLLDASRRRLVDNVTQLQVHGISTQESSPSPLVPRPTTANTFTTLLADFPPLLRPSRPGHQI